MAKKKYQKIKIQLDSKTIEEGKNTDGVSGEKCNNCSGFGFAMNIQGGKLACAQCESTGVKLPTIRELQDQISTLSKDLHSLRVALIKTLGFQGVELKRVGLEEVES